MSSRRHRHTSAYVLAAFLLAVAFLPAALAQAPTAPPASAPPAAGQQAGSPSQPALPADATDAVRRLTGAIEAAEKTIQHLTELEEELSRLRIDVESILSDSTDAAETLRPRLAAVRSQIERLGPPPAKDAAHEGPDIAAERARLQALASALDGAVRSTELTWVRARQLIEKITVLRHSLFTKNLMERLPSPLLPGLWRDLMTDAPGVAHRISYLAHDWWLWARAKQPQVLLLLGLGLLVFVAIGYATRRRRRRGAPSPEATPSFFQRAVSVAWVAPLRALPVMATAVLLYAGLDILGLLYAPWTRVAGAIVKAVITYAAVSALIGAVLAPSESGWRLVALADGPALRASRLIRAIAAVYALDAALTDMSRAFFVPLPLSVTQSFVASTAFAALLIGLLLTPFAAPVAPAPAAEAPGSAAGTAAAVSRHYPRWLKLPLWSFALAILGFALLGYVALARFLAQQLVLTGLVFVVGWLAYLAIRAVTRERQNRAFPVGEMLENRFGLDAPRRNQLARLTELALTLALVIAALPVLMLQWGFSGADIRDWFKALFFGLEIGQFRISLARILLGIVLFMALLLATRLFQRWLRERALQQTRLDPGIVNSVDTVVGYAGIGLAALIAVSYAGLDITNLAIVAGALSVGIGFGLQSIVNNFVSGLILLIERPIKVGDRIVVGDQQGLVRRISVRATEVETFDRASLIVPNSELVTGRVLNWTHRDSLGAVNVKVGVAYDADPEQVIAILKKCADDHPQVLRAPAPGAILESFGDSALQFNLRVSLADINVAPGVQSDLRIAILKTLREAGIEMPFNQLDVNVKSQLAQITADRPEGASAAAHAHATAGNGKRGSASKGGAPGNG